MDLKSSIQRRCVILKSEIELIEGEGLKYMNFLISLYSDLQLLKEYSRQRLIDRGLKVFLHGLLIKHSNTSKESSICPSIVIPVELRRLYMMTDLESAKRVGVKPSSVEPDETKKVNKGLPLLKNLRPAHGTVKDLFIDGYPGLIQS